VEVEEDEEKSSVYELANIPLEINNSPLSTAQALPIFSGRSKSALA
jgi:hypothetical protein